MAYQSQDIIRRSATNGFTPAPQARDHQQEVAKLAETAIEYPPMQKGSSFNLEAVKAQIEAAVEKHAGQ